MTDPETGPVRASWVTVGGPVEPWRDAGFTVGAARDAGDAGDTGDAGVLRLEVGAGVIVDPSQPPGVRGWWFEGLPPDAPPTIDGLPLLAPPIVGAVSRAAERTSGDHPNGALAIDHLVIDTDSLERTCDAIATVTGAPLKRVRELGVARQGFHRLETFVIEVVERVERGDQPPGARFWGLTFTVSDLDGAAALLGADRCGAVKDAVQPGRRIATLRRSAGVGLPVALMSPRPPR